MDREIQEKQAPKKRPSINFNLEDEENSQFLLRFEQVTSMIQRLSSVRVNIY